MKEARTEKKSIRLSQTAASYIEDAEGTSFNDKLENFILYSKEGEPKLTKRINKMLDDIDTLDEAIRDKRELLNKLKTIESYLRQATNYIER